MVPLWIPRATPIEEFGRTQETTTSDGSIARYTVESEDYDPTGRTRSTHTRYELVRAGNTENLKRDWIIHWHTPEGFASMASESGLGVSEVTPIVDGEFTAFLHRS